MGKVGKKCGVGCVSAKKKGPGVVSAGNCSEIIRGDQRRKPTSGKQSPEERTGESRSHQVKSSTGLNYRGIMEISKAFVLQGEMGPLKKGRVSIKNELPSY